MTNPKDNERKAESLRRIADTLADPKDAEIVRGYAAEIIEADVKRRKPKISSKPLKEA